MSETTEITHTVSTEGPAQGMTFTMRRRPDAPVAAGAPLVVALPGGTYTSVYFDVPGQSLLGIAVSGCLVRVPKESGSAWAALPDLEFVELPGPVKDFVMYGPDWTHSAAMPGAGHAADAPVPKAELLDITGAWVDRMPEVAAAVVVPVHSRQGEFDRLWISDDDQVAEFKAAFTSAPWVDARLVPNAGHCIDFHLAGKAFQLEQVAFALEAALHARRPAASPESAADNAAAPAASPA